MSLFQSRSFFCGLLISANVFVKRPERQRRRSRVAFAFSPLLFCRASLGYQHSGMCGMHLARCRVETEPSVCCKQVVCIVNVDLHPAFTLLHPHSLRGGFGGAHVGVIPGAVSVATSPFPPKWSELTAADTCVFVSECVRVCIFVTRGHYVPMNALCDRNLCL